MAPAQQLDGKERLGLPPEVNNLRQLEVFNEPMQPCPDKAKIAGPGTSSLPLCRNQAAIKRNGPRDL